MEKRRRLWLWLWSCAAHWESLFREGRAARRFGRQITEFACIYTSRVSKFLGYPADKFFSRPLEVLPHERWALPES
jgi:hypothetical protein